MKRVGSPFRRYLQVHFLLAALLPILLLFTAVGVAPSRGHADAETLKHLRNTFVIVGFVVAAFIAVSWIFFYRLRKRLVRLQEAMAVSSEGSGLPKPVSVRTDRLDEIGRLEASFNRMIRQLEDSRRREQEEESLRRRLIANLSHDLRTPLTAIRGHAARLRKEPLSPEGRGSLEAMDLTITHAGDLIDDLLSYTLLTSGKYPYRPEPTDLVRLVRSAAAAWYPAFESAGFRIEAELPEESGLVWEVDPQWMRRVLDNLFQNIHRHARDGRYIGIAVNVEREELAIEDNGPGLGGPSEDRGAGIGLSIALYMLKEMKLQALFESGENGTTVRIIKI
ncbi:HAMP domain-containing sensor histidine kinase [Cohnella caldifontis]|uniref:HAMP domain-containing sensor histidine kinase n=1 Tax=Cohnella caldifontis TaxID=3027471 RepID=UPI0023ECE19B|nr:HAMP domain-containing sensor histidine kinase [Cohnella sp. YIM B05605]